MVTKNYLVAFLAILLIGMAADTAAQNPIKINDLTFGNMFPGVPEVIDKKAAGAAAEFHISGNPGDEVEIVFTLPEYMAQSGHNVQLVFSNTDCAIDSSATPDQASPGQDNLNPWQPITYRLGSGGLTVWLGGMAIPKLVQQSGDYTGVIVLRVEYTGN